MSRSLRSRLWGRLVLPAIYRRHAGGMLDRLRELQRSERLDPEQLANLQDRKLARVLQAADRHPFWKARFKAHGVDPDDPSPRRAIAALPPLSRDELRELSRLTRERLPRGGRIAVRQTAGTSGVPARVYADREAQSMILAARWRSFGWFGVVPGDRELRVWGRPLTAKERWVGGVKEFLLNRALLGTAEFEAGGEVALRRAQSAHADYVYGYTSLVTLLAHELLERRVPAKRLGWRAAIVTAEPCRDSDLATIRRAFGCPVSVEFGNSETDIVSSSCPEGRHHLQAENLLVEPLSGSENHAGVPEVLLTDLNNRLMPLIRYRVGDRMKLLAERCGCGRSLPLVAQHSGRAYRQSYLVRPDGTKLASYVFDYYVDALVSRGFDLRQAQVTQVSRERVEVRLVLGQAEAQQEALRMLESALQPQLGNQVAVAVEFPSQITPPVGRKFELFEPLPEGRG